MSQNHPVTEDFGGVLQRLDRDVFDVTYMILHEKSHPMENADFMLANIKMDTIVNFAKDKSEVFNGAWVRRIGEEIENHRFDIILYLDMTMSSFVRRLGMERLAPVQVNTHGHPVTSGHPRSVIQHFVSWSEAELPLEESQAHYTEDLELIPKGKIHQYYTPRVSTGPDGRRFSRMNGQPFDNVTRTDLGFPRNILEGNTDANIYVCMQKPHKVRKTTLPIPFARYY